MSASTIDFETADSDELECRNGPVLRTAFYLKGCGEPVFAWLHQSSVNRSVDHGVIICSPVGHEQLHSHRGLRHLADRLAKDSFPTLRFDWHGTGDSPGTDVDPDRCAVWLSNIRDAVEWMRQQLGCRKISLVGLRMGGTLAALSTLDADTEIDNLILWSPVTKGRTYVREMKALGLTSEAPLRPSLVPSNDIEAAGFTLSAETAAELSEIDLLECRPECRRILVVCRADLPDDDRLCNLWATAGIHVQQVASPGYVEMMAEPHRNQVPKQSIREITDWLRNIASVDVRKLASDDDPIRTSSIQLPADATAGVRGRAPDQIRESTFRISSHPDLFGIVSEPQFPVIESRPTIILLNAGSAHRVAPSRINVLIARRLAVDGFRCMRMDLNGLGDSISESIECENDSYPATAFRDIELAMKKVQQRFGATKIVLMGLCSGAYDAFQSAAQIANPALVESVLINPLTFFWREGMTLDASPTKHLMSFHYYQSVVLNPKKWVKLLTGNSKIGVVGAACLLAKRLGLLKPQNAKARSPQPNTRKAMGLSHPLKEDLAADLATIAGRNRRLAMFFSRTDPGFSILNHHAKRQATQMQRTRQLKIEFIEDADHTFTRSPARRDLIEAISVHIQERYR